MRHCKRCQQEFEMDHFDSRVKNGTTYFSCSVNRKAKQVAWYDSNKQRIRENEFRYQKSRDPRMRMIVHIRSKAKRDNIPFDLDYTDIVIPDTCPLLGIPLFRGEGKLTRNSPSLDRIIPELGYIRGNVQVMSFKANTMKNDASSEELRTFCTRMLSRLESGPEYESR